MNLLARRRCVAYPCLFVVLAGASVAVLLNAARLPEISKFAAPHDHLDAPGLFQAYCGGCHASGRTRIEFDGTPTLASVHQEPALWQNIAGALRARQMPPPDMPSANPKDCARMVVWVEDSLRTLDRARLAARRLSALEYRNAIR